SVLGARRITIRQLAEPEILLPLARPRGSPGAARVHGPPPQGLRDAHGRVRVRQDHAVARPHPAARGRPLRDRPPDQPELDPGRVPPRGALPARCRDGREEQARASPFAERRLLPELPGRTRQRRHRGRGAAARRLLEARHGDRGQDHRRGHQGHGGRVLMVRMSDLVRGTVVAPKPAAETDKDTAAKRPAAGAGVPPALPRTRLADLTPPPPAPPKQAEPARPAPETRARAEAPGEY